MHAKGFTCFNILFALSFLYTLGHHINDQLTLIN